MSASDFIKVGQENKKTIHEDLEAMKQKQKEMLTRNDNTMVNIQNEMKQTLSCVLIPYMTADESGYLINGYAVFDQLALKDYLDRQTSDGVEFFRNLMRVYPIDLNNQVGLQITYTKTKLKADLKDKKITITVKVSFETMVKEVLTGTDIFTLGKLNSLTGEQNDYISDILKKPVKYSIDNGLDILNLARVVENQNISGWQNIKESWPELISKIQYNYKIQSRISKSFINN
jgi:spore germination protein KC